MVQTTDKIASTQNDPIVDTLCRTLIDSTPSKLLASHNSWKQQSRVAVRVLDKSESRVDKSALWFMICIKPLWGCLIFVNQWHGPTTPDWIVIHQKEWLLNRESCPFYEQASLRHKFFSQSKSFLYVFSLASCFAKHWQLVFVLSFLKDVQYIEKTKNPSRETSFWTSCAKRTRRPNNRSRETYYSLKAEKKV